MRRSRSLTTLRLSLLCCSVSLALPLAAQEPPSPPPFVETIEVREVEVRVDLSALPRFESIGRKGREDFIVVEDGVAHPLTGLHPAQASQWIFVLYFDSVLAGPDVRQQAAIEIAKLAEQLTAGGLAEIVLADPQPHTVLSTDSAEVLRHALDELALAAGRERPRSEPSVALATTARLDQLDRLSVEIAARGGGGARGLLLPVGAWPIAPEGLARLTQTRAGAGAELLEFRPLQESARVLAGYGWVTLPIALRAPREEQELSAAEKRMQVSTGGAGDRRQSVPIVSISAQEPQGDPATAAQVDTLTDFSLMPFAELSRVTSGALIGDAGRLRSRLAQLIRRRQFIYRSPFPQPGHLLTLEVRWKGGDGRRLQAPHWLRSSTPPEVSAARLRRLLAGDAAPQAGNAGGVQWNAATGRVCFPGDGDKRWVRLSTATEKDGQIQIATGKPVQLERSPDGLCTDAVVVPGGPPAGGGRTVRVVEDLENESWTGAGATAN